MVIRNTAANLVGQLLYPLLALALVPFYIGRLGLEGYGFIGLMALVLSLLGVFSRGLGAALQREVSRRGTMSAAGTLRRLLRSMEVVYWAAAALLAVGLSIFAVAGGNRWVTPSTLSASDVTTCLLLLALRVGLAFPHSVYQAIIMGAERQVLGSSINAAMAITSAAAGVVAVVTQGSVMAVYAAETITAGIYLAVFRHFAYRILPAGSERFDREEISGLARISGALMWTSGVGLLISSLDRLFVSTLLPVTALGVYTIAVMGGRTITLFINPFLQASYPVMCRIAGGGSADEQSDDLLRNAAVVVVITATVGLPLCAFSAEALALWVRDAQVVERGAPVMSWYVAGSLLVAASAVLHQWQTASGRTRAAVLFNLAALLWFPIALSTALVHWGLPGAAAIWTLYGALAWLLHLGATFGATGLPRRSLYVYLGMIVRALGPAVLITVAARVAADRWLADVIAGRIALAGVAALTSGLWALTAVASRFGPGGVRGRFVKIAAGRTGRKIYNT